MEHLFKHLSLKHVKEIFVPFLFSEEHLKIFTNIQEYSNLNDLIKLNNEIKELK